MAQGGDQTLLEGRAEPDLCQEGPLISWVSFPDCDHDGFRRFSDTLCPQLCSQLACSCSVFC